jgi:hypothetical protein
MSLALQDKGVISAFTDWASGALTALHLPWPALFAALHLQFYLLHYMFASKTAHVGALYAAFLSLLLAGGAWFASLGEGGVVDGVAAPTAVTAQITRVRPTHPLYWKGDDMLGAPL